MLVSVATFMQQLIRVETMTTATMQETLVGSLAEGNNARWPALFVGILLARSLGLAAGVALMILLAAALLSMS